MGRGILAGLVWGSILSVLVLGVASQMAPLPDRQGRDAAGPDTSGDAVSDPAPGSGMAPAKATDAVTAPVGPEDPAVPRLPVPALREAPGSAPMARLAQPEADTLPEAASSLASGDATSGQAPVSASVSGTTTATTRPVETGATTDAAKVDRGAPLPNSRLPSGSAAQSDAVSAPGAVASEVAVPAGSEFRRALPDTEARLPAATDPLANPELPVAPAAVTKPAAAGASLPAAGQPARPATPGMGIDAPSAPDADEAAPTAAEIAPADHETTAPAVVSPAEPDLPEITPEAPAAAADLPASAPLSGEDAEAPKLAPPEPGGALPAVAPLGDAEVPRAAAAGRVLAADSVAEDPALQPVVIAAAKEPDVAAPGRPGAAPPDDEPAASAHAADPEPDRSRPQLSSDERLPRTAPTALRGPSPARPRAIPAATFAVPLGDALTRNAAPFDPPKDKPLVSVVLIHRPAGAALPLQDLRAVGVPVAVALDPADPGAAAAAASLRSAGIEVLALGPALAPDLYAADAEARIVADLNALPGALALMEPDAGDFSGSPAQAVAVTEAAARNGHGIVVWPDAHDRIGPAAALADRPLARIFAPLDAGGEDAAAIRRALDQATDSAVATGRTLVVGHTRPGTLAALSGWAATPGLRGLVAPAPVSAQFTAQ
ncbi:divergent polysaccharide deacetylase family protein [Tropicimonas sp. IMCC34043]|uniref:divergent polysaccharide deacetylase family protein n=1 Tax=Tropicimonas sp. IMCC34043 TaxID=2248760 RepID=UPI000E21F49D|nr:divergent polysaccharide deacetylase family protein [Tropicimonas sp. IMCC34043]